MKKNKILRGFGLVGLVLVLVVGAFVTRRAISTITYSNLASPNALDEVVEVLREQGVSEKNLTTFTQQVNFTNEYLKTLPNLQGDFTTKRGAVSKYDGNLAFNLFAAVVLPEDMNCRIAAFNLLKDVIKADGIAGEIELAEEYILQSYPYVGFEEGDKEAFWGVFKGIETSGFQTTGSYVKTIQKAWQERGVSFEHESMSLISCFAYANDNKWLEAVHVGVKIETEEGLLFIEKINPKAPFQASKFKDDAELKYYLQQRMMDYFILQPIIMENDVAL
ncbi:MAG: DUF4300 family protein [Erysipelotrichaceae bacterium]